MEVSNDIVALHILTAELDFSVSLILVLLEISERDLENTSLQAFGRNLRTRSASDQGLSSQWLGEHRRRLNIVPFLLQERVGRLLLAALLGLRQALVLACKAEAQ